MAHLVVLGVDNRDDAERLFDLHRYEVIASPLTATPYPARRVP
jgi:hypothetical protein